MSIPEIEFPLYLRHPEWRGDKSKAPAARTVETTATVLVDLDVHGRVIGVELLGEVPLTPEWGLARFRDGEPEPEVFQAFGEDETGARESLANHRAHRERIGEPPWRRLMGRQVTGWVEVDEKAVSE